MKETIEAYVVIKDKMRFIFLDKGNAETEAQIGGGTVVKLTGEVPRVPRKVSTEVWICPSEPVTNGDAIGMRIGYLFWSPKKTETCTIRAKITLQELSDDES